MVQKVAAIGIKGRDKLVSGANYLADAVKTTLGPSGQNFAIEKGNRITNDGITIGREIIGSQDDEIEERGAKLLLEASSKANDEAGDGSTTTMVLAQAVLKEAIRMLPKEGQLAGKMSPAELVKKINEECAEVIEKLKAMSTPVESEEQMIKIALVSVEDEELATLIGKAQWELGADGFLLAEETNDRECSVEKVNGLLIDNGFGSSATINNPEKEALELFDVRVIYTNHTVSSLEAIKPTLESLVKSGQKQIVVMARAFTESAIRECLTNMEAGIGIFPLNAAYTDQAEMMMDLQSVLGGRFINSEVDSLDALQLSDVGFAKHVLAKRMSTVFTGGEGREDAIATRIETLEQKREGSPSQFEKKNLSSRIAQLKNGFALIKIGAISETERKYKKDKADDAVNAVRAALQEGVLPGAGQALVTVANELPDEYLLKNALKAPYEQIVANAGKTLDIPEWVQDSTKVTRVALEKACSVAATLATAAGAITTRKPKDVCCKQPTSQG